MRKLLGSSRADDPNQNRRSERLAILGSGAVFAAVGLTGLHFFPGAKFLWFALLVFALLAIPQAFYTDRIPPGSR